MKNSNQHIGVIGGGMLGMTLAHRLRQQGYEVTLFEAAEQLGGLTTAWQIGDVTWDKFYHVILLSDRHLRNLLTELDLEQDIQWNETRTGFYTDGQLYSLSNTFEFLNFPPLNLFDKFRLALNIFYASKIKNWQKLEGQYATEWLKKWSGQKTFEKIWLPLLRAKLGSAYNEASAAFIWATIARLYGARKSGLKKEMFGYVDGGYDTILARFAQVLEQEGVTIRTGHAANEVTREDSGRIAVSFDNGSAISLDRVVLTVPAPISQQLVTELSDDEKKSLANINYLGIVCASVLLEKPLADFYVTNITDSHIPFTGVIEMTSIVDRSRFGGYSLVYLPKYLPGNDIFWAKTDDEIRELFLANLAEMYPDFDANKVVAFQIARAKHVFALSTINYSQQLTSMRTSVPGVYIANSAHIVNGTLNVNETVQLAERAADLIVADERNERA